MSGISTYSTIFSLMWARRTAAHATSRQDDAPVSWSLRDPRWLARNLPICRDHCLPCDPPGNYHCHPMGGPRVDPGNVNLSGCLPYTIAKSPSDYPTHLILGGNSEEILNITYSEGCVSDSFEKYLYCNCTVISQLVRRLSPF